MTQYAIYFHQQWVGDHPAEWYQTRVKPSTDVVLDMEKAGVLVFAGGLVEDRCAGASAPPRGSRAPGRHQPASSPYCFVSVRSMSSV